MSSWVVGFRIHWLWLGDYWYYWVLYSLGNSYHPVNIRTAGDIRYLKGCNREVVTRWLSAHLSTTQDRIQAAGFCFTGCVWNFNLPQYNLPASYRFVWTFGEKDPILDGWWSISFIFLVEMAISDPFRYHFPCCAPCYLGAIPTISSLGPQGSARWRKWKRHWKLYACAYRRGWGRWNVAKLAVLKIPSGKLT